MNRDPWKLFRKRQDQGELSQKHHDSGEMFQNKTVYRQPVNPTPNVSDSWQRQVEEERKAEERRKDWPLKRFGWLALAVFVAAIAFYSSTGSGTVLNSDAAKQALVEQVSSSLPAGAVLLSEDQNLEQKDHTIDHQSDQDSMKIQVWDYAAEDGDYVQILHNGTPITDAFMIKHRPQSFTVPTVGEVQIRGVRDGGGGITYAVRYELNGTTYLNSVKEGEFNTYTLIRE
jgi:hypothetical protein